MNKRIIIGLSGGIDSSVSALLLKLAGWDVIGVTATLDKTCPNAQYSTKTNSQDAQNICEFLNIPHFEVDYSEIFELVIVDSFFQDYIHGYTPNPCVWCNKKIKWSAFAKIGKEIGCDNYATGHYARGEIIDGRWNLLKGIDKNKDQSYFLCHVPYETLSKSIFPLGSLTKHQVKQIAIENKLPVIPSKESNDICFLRYYNDRSEFFKTKYSYSSDPIKVIDSTGRKYECLKSIEQVTYGQRAPVPLPGQPVNYIWKIDADNNTVYVAPKGMHFIKSIEIENFNFTSKIPLNYDKEYQVKTRYRQSGQPAKINYEGSMLEIEFIDPTEHIAPGQWGVVYDNDIMIGGGRITDRHLLD